MSDEAAFLRADAKARLRRHLKAARRAFTDRALATAQLTDAILTLPHWSTGPERVAVYAAHGHEADMAPAAQALEARGVELLYPRVDGDRLSFVACAPEALLPRAYGILEPPADAPACPLGSIDLFFVPGLGFTPRGDRLGYGRGYYDRALAEAARGTPNTADLRDLPYRRLRRAGRIGVAFSVQIVETLPTEPHDVRLDGLVTERGYLASIPEPGL